MANDPTRRGDDFDGAVGMTTGVGTDRIGALMATRRYADAEREVRRMLAQEPGAGHLHVTLSYILSELEKYQEATREAEIAIGLQPDNPGAHHALCTALYGRDRFPEAIAAAREALRLDPYDADYHASLAACLLARRDWSAALRQAEEGLALDPDHLSNQNLRAVALRQLGRADEAAANTRRSLARDPNDAVGHANQGWTELHRRNHPQALIHFREALRLDPTLEFAREGIVEALKAKNPLYRLLLRWKLWMSRLSVGGQWAVIISLYVIYRAVSSLARQNPEWAPVLYPLMGLYFIFALLTWIGDPFFDTLLRLNRFGRLALSDNQRRNSNILLIFLAVIAGGVGAWVMTGSFYWLVAAGSLGLIMLPASHIYNCAAGWPRAAMAGYTVGLLLIWAGLAAVLVTRGAGEPSPLFTVLLVVFGLGIFGSWIVANYLGSVRPRR